MNVFLDDGGVMSDNERRFAQWPPLLGVFLAERLGGDPAAWVAANRSVAHALWQGGGAELKRRTAGLGEFQRAIDLAWLGGMCAAVGMTMPEAHAALSLVDAAKRHVSRRIHAAIPGAVAATRALAAAGHVLHTASAETSIELDGYLTAMGVRRHFRHLFGPDLVDCFKDGPEYYKRIFAHAGVDPAGAVVVDDDPTAVGWAAAAGARSIWVGVGEAPAAAAAAVRRLAQVIDIGLGLG